MSISAVRRHKALILLGAFIFLAATISFTAGYLTAQQGQHSPIIIEKCSSTD